VTWSSKYVGSQIDLRTKHPHTSENGMSDTYGTSIIAS
jgi:hypothetical protein